MVGSLRSQTLIVLGLALFALGGALAALSDSIFGIIAGRALQGAGAVAGVIMALAADLTREEHRTKAMALIGISIGFSFALSMVAGPVLSTWMGLTGLFWVITALALLGIALVFTVVPTPVVTRFHRDTEVQTASFGTVLAHPELLRLDFGIFSCTSSSLPLLWSCPYCSRIAWAFPRRTIGTSICRCLRWPW